MDWMKQYYLWITKPLDLLLMMSGTVKCCKRVPDECLQLMHDMMVRHLPQQVRLTVGYEMIVHLLSFFVFSLTGGV